MIINKYRVFFNDYTFTEFTADEFYFSPPIGMYSFCLKKETVANFNKDKIAGWVCNEQSLLIENYQPSKDDK